MTFPSTKMIIFLMKSTVILSIGNELLHLKRAGSSNTSVTSFIEYNDLRKQSMDYYDQVRAVNALVENASKVSNPSCSIVWDFFDKTKSLLFP